jgi:hypothetical protein
VGATEQEQVRGGAGQKPILLVPAAFIHRTAPALFSVPRRWLLSSRLLTLSLMVEISWAELVLGCLMQKSTARHTGIHNCSPLG